MLRSLKGKLITIYMIIVFLFIVVLGMTLTVSYHRSLTQMRKNDILDCAEQISEMFADGTLSVVELENGMNIPVLMTTAKDFDATIQVVNASSKRIFYNVTEKNLEVVSSNRFVDEQIYNTVVIQRSVYIKENGKDPETGAPMLTVAYPIKYYSAIKYPDDENTIWAILVINSDLTAINKIYSNIISILWVPIIIISVVGFLLFLVLINGIVSRIKELKNATSKIAHGNFDERVPIKSNDEITALSIDFNNMAAELKKSDQSKKDFVSNAAHELRSPMTSINGFVEGMLDGTIPVEQYKMYLEIVSSETKRLTKLVKSMLDLSRIESGTVKLNVERFDINELIRRVVVRLSPKIEAKGIIPEISLYRERLFVNADPDKIEEVVQNLLDNAIKFTGTGKKITIKTRLDGIKVLVAIKDEGTGISQEDIQFIWDRFYTVDKAHTGHKSGTGLGLSIVKSIIEQHGEKINVQSKSGSGTEFEFSLEYGGE